MGISVAPSPLILLDSIEIVGTTSAIIWGEDIVNSNFTCYKIICENVGTTTYGACQFSSNNGASWNIPINNNNAGSTTNGVPMSFDLAQGLREVDIRRLDDGFVCGEYFQWNSNTTSTLGQFKSGYNGNYYTGVNAIKVGSYQNNGNFCTTGKILLYGVKR